MEDMKRITTPIEPQKEYDYIQIRNFKKSLYYKVLE